MTPVPLRRRALLAAVCGALLSAVYVAPASAADPFANYVTQVTGISPALTGVTATAPADGSWIEVTNTSGTPLIVEGYQGEPYLKITDHGVWQNESSPSTYLNKEYSIDTIPSSVNAQKPPQWQRTSDGSTARWHDHRIHWMGALEPPDVAADHSHPHLIKTWAIGLVYGLRKASIRGSLTWRPSSSLGTYLTYGGVGAALVVALGLALFARRRRPPAAPVGV